MRGRPCAYGCGLTADDGDVYCPGCRQDTEQETAMDRMNSR